MPSMTQSRGRMAVATVVLAALATCGSVGSASAGYGPKVVTQVVGPNGLIAGPKTAMANTFSLWVGTGSKRHRCAVVQGSPMAALNTTGASMVIRDFGKCSTRTADSASLFVDTVAGFAGTGMEGWSYKVGGKAGTAGAADPAGPFGSGLLRGGAQVLWFWCVYDPTTYACQRSLQISTSARVRANSTFSVSVRALDDSGAAVAASGVRVSITGAAASVVTGADGKATFSLAGAGNHTVKAVDASVNQQTGRRPDAFPVTVKVY